jgi:DNA-binding FrmR family transcriptional regulator
MAQGIRHAAHGDVAKRLKRAEGHLRAVIAMLEAGRPCVELAQQLAAIEAAVGKAKRALVETHIDHCLDRAVEEGRAAAALAEMREIAKYL